MTFSAAFFSYGFDFIPRPRRRTHNSFSVLSRAADRCAAICDRTGRAAGQFPFRARKARINSPPFFMRTAYGSTPFQQIMI